MKLDATAIALAVSSPRLNFPSSFQHQQQVLTAVERAKQVSMSELNAIIGVSATTQLQCGRTEERGVKAIYRVGQKSLS